METSLDTRGTELKEMGNLPAFLGKPLILLEEEDAVAEIMQLELDEVDKPEVPAVQTKEELSSVQYQRRANRPAIVEW